MSNAKFSACLLLMLAIIVPAMQAQDNSSVSNVTTTAFAVASPTSPKVKMTVIGFTGATIGKQITGFPCMGGQSGCADNVKGTIAIPAPLAAVMPGDLVTYTFQFHDVSYNGTCSLSYTLMEGNTKLSSGQYKFASGCKAKTEYFTSFNVKQLGTMGIATLNAKVKAGKNQDTISQKFCIQ